MTNINKTNKARNKGTSKGRSMAQDRRRMRRTENMQVEVTRDVMLGKVARRGPLSNGMVARDGPR